MKSDGMHVWDASAIGVAAATFMGWLPNVAAVLSVVWLGMRVYSAYLEIKEQKRRMKDDSE